MVATAKKNATIADIDALPEGIRGEILFGSLVTQPRPVPRHAAAHVGMFNFLLGPYQYGPSGPGGWIFLTEPDLYLGPHVVVPDLAGWRRERFTESPDQVGLMVAPDWVCEILSKSTLRYDRNEKRRIYASAGVNYYWILDPIGFQLDCFKLVGGQWLLTDTFTRGEIISAEPFPAAVFAFDALFPFDPPEKVSE